MAGLIPGAKVGDDDDHGDKDYDDTEKWDVLVQGFDKEVCQREMVDGEVAEVEVDEEAPHCWA